MDTNGSVGPDKGDFNQDCRIVANKLVTDCVFVSLCGRGSRLELTLVRRERLTVPGRGPEGADRDENYIFVAVREKGAYWFILDAFHSPSYVAEKLGLVEVDGELVADFLTRVAKLSLHLV